MKVAVGGTSNHFRRRALTRVGAWDPCNVTEDADLGARLARFGYRIGTIAAPTLEEAPADLATWLPQRTRWFKGWAQTWLVHMRNPLSLWRELGPASFLVCQIMFAGMLVSALIHPLFLATILALAVCILGGVTMSATNLASLLLGRVSITLGYCAFLALGYRALGRGGRVGCSSE